MLHTHTKTIDGEEYTTETLTTSEGLTVMPKLAGIFGDNALAIMFMPEAQRKVAASDEKLMAVVVHSIAKQTDEGELLCVRELLKRTTSAKVQVGESEGQGNVAERFDSHFRGRYKHLMNVVMWVGSVNFMES